MCTRNACRTSAVATLTYVYADQTAVVGPLATYAEPHTYDLCPAHAAGLTAPRGWDIVRLAGDYSEPAPTHDDLLALADAVREAGRPRHPEQPAAATAPTVVRGGYPGAAGGQVTAAAQPAGIREPGRRRHLRVIADADA
jgi:hypothetical protein